MAFTVFTKLRMHSLEPILDHFIAPKKKRSPLSHHPTNPPRFLAPGNTDLFPVSLDWLIRDSPF